MMFWAGMGVAFVVYGSVMFVAGWALRGEHSNGERLDPRVQREQR